MMTEIQIMKGEDRRNKKNLVITLLEFILINQILMNMKNLVRYKSTSKIKSLNKIEVFKMDR